MSILKFELTENHLKLVKHLKWDELNNNKITTKGETPFDGFDYYEDMGVILFGKPDDFNVDDLLDAEVDPFNWSDEQKVLMDSIYKELPMAIEVILNTQSFVPGDYKCKFHIREWKLKK